MMLTKIMVLEAIVIQYQALWTPPFIPLPSDETNLHTHAFRPMARSHANTLSTKAAQNRMPQRHHKKYRSPPTQRIYAPMLFGPTARSKITQHSDITDVSLSSRSGVPQTKKFNTTSIANTANHPAPQRRKAFTHSCFWYELGVTRLYLV